MNQLSKNMLVFYICVIIYGHGIAPLNARASEPIVIGILHSEAYPYATMMKNSFKMALEKINNTGGIKSRPLKLAFANDQGEPRSGEKAIKKLIKYSRPVMLVGAYQSSNAIYMTRTADRLI